MTIVENLMVMAERWVNKCRQEPVKHAVLARWIERFFKWFGGALALPLPLDILRFKKVLVMRRDMIGDMIVITPVFKLLHDANPALRIDVWASQENAVIIRHNPYITKIFSVSYTWHQFWRNVREARAEQYDLILELSFARRTFQGLLCRHIAPTAVRIQDQIFDLDRFHRWLYHANVVVVQQQMAPYFCAVVAAAFGLSINAATVNPQIYLADSHGDQAKKFLQTNAIRAPFAVLNVSGREACKTWGIERISDFLKIVTERVPPVPFVLVAAPSDHQQAQLVIQKYKECAAWLFPSSDDYLDVCALVRLSALLISADTAIVHAAASYAVPVVDLCTDRSTTPYWLPYGRRQEILWAPAGQGASAIEAQTVFEAFTRLWVETTKG